MEAQLWMVQQAMLRVLGGIHTARQELDAAQQRLEAQPQAHAVSPLIDTRM